MKNRIIRNKRFRHQVNSFLRKGGAIAGLLWSAHVLGQSVTDYDAVPPLLAESATPLVMLALSNDHQLYFKAFTDYDDLDGDGVIDTTYKNEIEYAGYFDSFKCYHYSTTNRRFEPVSYTATKYCNDTATDEWSGNFLNWATMTRLDEVRKVLYGGYRAVDTPSLTVLERAHIAGDAHSFAKHYAGPDLRQLAPFGSMVVSESDSIHNGITMCNITKYTGTEASQAVTEPPLMRVVSGNFSLWAANERFQCLLEGEFFDWSIVLGTNGNDPAYTGIFAHSSSPSTSDVAVQANGSTIGDYIVRVEACRSSLKGKEDCKTYPAGSMKPVGLLQEFGDDSSVHWGLMSGSYLKNKSGGVLRKNISQISDEVNVDTDGTFKAAPATGGIINTISKFRLVNYKYDGGDNDNRGTYNGADNCRWGKSSFNNGECTNWGNPFTELMLECYRYFAGKSPTSNFDANDETLLAGLTRQTAWLKPQAADNACAQMSVIAFNASTVSYDGDELDGVADLNTTLSARALTKAVGDGEGITGKSYFVGENGTDNDQLCTAKTINDLGLVEGTCPDAARLKGSFKVAGIAHHARTADLRPDLDGVQSVATYGVTLSPAIPKVTIAVPGGGGKTVTLLPACRNASISGNCGLVDFKIVEQMHTDEEASGKFYVNWEDSEQGGDYDQDLNGVVSYRLTGTELKVITKVFGASTSFEMGFGYIVSGTTNDGFHVHSGINGYSGYDCGRYSGTDNNFQCDLNDIATTKLFSLGASTAAFLEQPLYYAAKWGGFTDVNGSNTPDRVSEWDKKNNVTGALESDGIPDNYFLAINPKQLKFQLTSILVDILERTASGTSAAVVSNTGAGEGALYQALYNPRFADAAGTKAVSWVGTLNALFIDRYGNLREDSAEPYGTLTADDHLVRVYYDAFEKKTQIQRYLAAADGTRGAAVGPPADVSEINAIWNARDALASVEDYVSQRSAYGNVATSGRYIFTGIDLDGDGQIGMSAQTETFPFEAGLFNPDTSNNFRLLGLDSSTKTEAAKIVNFIRGDETISGYRSRSLDIDGDGIETPWLLGDIVHSSPVAVGRPSTGYDVTFGDETYRAFRQKYESRRQVVYVGANDGMLHAFNSGFFDAQTLSYLTTKNGATAHPLGSELWAYVPYNLLPHLKWLTQPDYPHVYYMDGSVYSYDVNIFPDDATHPGGWGTIIVAGMRLGGGEYGLDPDSDADTSASDDITMRSAYVILDVTDPEQPPVLLAEISDVDLGYTTVEPAVLKMRSPDALTGSYSSPALNKWYLVFGSGPAGSNQSGRAAALTSAVSDKSAKLFFFDLAAKTLFKHNTGAASSFVGGIATADWNRDYIDDAFYFGTVGGTVDAPTGQLRRGIVSPNPSVNVPGFVTVGAKASVAVSELLDVTDQPFGATPLTVRDRQDDLWVYAGTGRFFVVADNFSNARQSYYGIKEPKIDNVLTLERVAKTNLIDTTDIQVFTDGSVRSTTTLLSPVTLNNQDEASTFADVLASVSKQAGWYFDFSRSRARNTTKAVVSDQSLVFTEYQPSGLKCQPEGQGFLNAVHLQAGIPAPFAALGTDPDVTFNRNEQVLMGVSLGHGSPSTPQIHQRGDGVKSAIVQNSTGEISWRAILSGGSAGQRQSWREIPITW